MSPRLSRSQVLMIGCAFVLDGTLVSKPSLVIRDLRSDFWLAYLIALAYGLAAIVAVGLLASRFPRKDLMDGLVSSYPILGRAIVAGYVLFFFGILVRDVRSTTDFVKVSLLTITPLTAVAVCLGLCIIAIARHGKTSVGRMSQLWQPMLVLLVLGIPIFLASTLVLGNLLPAFQHPFPDVFYGASHIVAYAGEATGIAFIATSRTWTFRYGIYSVLLGWTLLTILTVCLVLSLGVEIPARTLYPNYEMIRKIRLTDFLDRLDLPMVGIWLPAMIVKTSFSLYIASNGVARIFPKLRLSAISVVLGVAAVAVAILAFEHALQIFTFDQFWMPLSIVFQLALPVALLCLCMMHQRKKAARKGG